ncbi:MAG: crossover junction endodeoxyribonuclease [Candidatus Marinimicrobia bacterium]|jgi:crossover junction endodeoxyribonuclease RuvC|nr:crossover junction endodeoxyribonuclease [Candidatus Neomarinimicrobiota bacterium]
MYWTIGIDPGITGAVALIKHGDHLSVIETILDMPTMTEGKKQIINPNELISIFKNIRAEKNISKVYLEKVNAMPGQGVVSMFGFGRSYGIIESAVISQGFSLTYILPQQWKKNAGLLHKDKNEARTMAIRLFPNQAELFKRKSDIGRADALLIGLFGEKEEVPIR